MGKVDIYLCTFCFVVNEALHEQVIPGDTKESVFSGVEVLCSRPTKKSLIQLMFNLLKAI